MSINTALEYTTAFDATFAGTSSRPNRPGSLDASVYRRRRAAAGALAVAIAFVVFGIGSALLVRLTGETGLPSAGADVEMVDYIVQPGDTIWGIAEGLAPTGSDVRPMVDAIREAAGGVEVTAGQRILVPQG